MTLDENSRKIQETADRLDILELMAHYATALDTKNWEMLGSLFTDDACWEYTGTGTRQQGPAGIVGWLRRVVGPLEVTQHLNGNHVVRLHGDEAEHSCYYHAQHIRLGLPDGEQYIGAGRYEDLLRRSPDGWRFVRRTATTMWNSGNPAVTSQKYEN
jgi:ketosteroid isomerase-like protein